MRLALLTLVLAAASFAQQPIGIGPSKAGGTGPGIAKFFDWFTSTPSGCSNGAGWCVGSAPQGDTYYWTAWAANALGLPVTTGLPVIGTINDYNAGACSGNIGVLQLDKFSWATPLASHITPINCMTQFGTSPGSSNEPAGWGGQLFDGDSSGQNGTWKSRTPYVKLTKFLLPVERQVSAGNATVHDGTLMLSPDYGLHFCNPYTTMHHAVAPGCDSANWVAAGDAPICAASGHACTNAAYLDSSHSSIMWKNLPAGAENFSPINYAYQDGTTPPTISDAADCDPAVYTCYMLTPLGIVGRHLVSCQPQDISCWEYMTVSGWTSTLASAVPVLPTAYPLSQFDSVMPDPYNVTYIKEFGSYIMPGRGDSSSYSFSMAPRLRGPWQTIYWAGAGNIMTSHFISMAPALGYNVISADPLNVQMAVSSNSLGSPTAGQVVVGNNSGSPEMAMLDLVVGKSMSGEAFQNINLNKWVSGAGFQFSDSHMPGTFPRHGLVWAFDFLDQGKTSGITNWPYFSDRAGTNVVITGCEGAYAGTSQCGFMNSGHGKDMDNFGIKTTQGGGNYGHYHTAPDGLHLSTIQNTSVFAGNSSYTVLTVVRKNGSTEFSRPGGIFSSGASTSSDNTMIELNQVAGNLVVDWGATSKPHYKYTSNFTIPNNTDWYFIALTVHANTSAAPTAHLWVGGAVTPGVLADVIAGATYTAANGVSSQVPNITAGPLVIGMNADGDTSIHKGEQFIGTNAATVVYSRDLSSAEIQLVYLSMKVKMKDRGATLQ